LAVRTAGPPTALVPSLRRALAELDPDIPLAGVSTMDDVLSESVSFTRTVMAALVAFAAVAVFLAVVGLYGVLAYFVSRRTHEIGVRVALGAGVREVLGLVLTRGLIMVGLGLALGIAGALLGGRLVADLLFQVQASDPPTLVAVALLFTLVAAAACLVPAWRAWRVDPVEAFRAE
jgi:putative ABC transport system permease protein